MKTILRLLLIIALAALAAGCATGPKFAEVKDSIGNLSPEQGRIFFYRTTSLGAALQPKIRVNGEPVGKSVAKGFMFVDKDPGNYEVMTSTEVDRSLSLTLDKGQTRYVRFDVSIGFFAGHVYPTLVESDLGQQEILECSYTGPEL